jgi:hypothetical protein
VVKVVGPRRSRRAATYERNNLLLDLLRQRDDLEEQGKVDLSHVSIHVLICQGLRGCCTEVRSMPMLMGQTRVGGRSRCSGVMLDVVRC